MFEESAKLLVWLIPIFLLAVIILPQMIRILREYQRGVIFRLGMKRAMAGQAESERERRAKIINAEAEFQAEAS